MDWASALPILLGGGISLVSSLVIFGVASSYEQKKKREESHAERGMAASSGLHKLMHTLNFIENTARHVDGEFSDLERNTGNVDPSSLVRPIVGSGANFQLVSSSELSFLSERDGELAARIYEIQQRALNIDAIVNTYNELRLDHDKFIQQHITSIDGSRITVDIAGQDAFIAQANIGRLNQLVAGLVSSLEEDRRAAMSVVSDFISEAHKIHPKQFLNAKLKWREPKKC